MSVEDRIERARALYERAVYGGDIDALADSERDLDALEGDVALARGRIVHARFLHDRAEASTPPAEDPNELRLFQRAAELYRAVGDVRGEAEARFWIGCVHQVIRRDNDVAIPELERARELAVQVGDTSTEAEALRHLGIAAHVAGRLDEARERLEESSRLHREVGLLAGVAANMVGLAYVAAAEDRHATDHRAGDRHAEDRYADAHATLDEAYAIAEAHDAQAIVRQIEEARAAVPTSRKEGLSGPATDRPSGTP